MRRLIIASVLAVFALGLRAEPVHVVSSIKPLQLLVSAIGGDEVDSQLLLPPGFSPHDAQLRPSQWQMLNQAELLVWVGPALERFLATALTGRDNALALQSALRSEVGDDPHLWMNVALVSEMAVQLSQRLARLRPSKKALFELNTARLLSALNQQDAALRQAFGKEKPRYLLPHSGYRHFERQYGLKAAAVLSLNDEQMPGTAHIAELRSRMLAGEFDCVFREPQQSARLTERMLEGVSAPVVKLDPMGADVTNDRGGFERYYRSLAEAFLACQQAGRARLTGAE